MKTQLSISIPKACAHDWEEMSIAAGGRHCSSCEQDVKDFTAFSAKELQDWFSIHQNRKVCGRLQKHQLEAAGGINDR